VLINRESALVETYNNIDGDVVNFFRVLRDRHEELIRAITLTPFSREEYYRAIYGVTKGISDVERARRFYIKARQTRTGLAQTASLGRWANCKDTSRAGMSGVVSRWLGGVDALDEIAQRLIRVQIENRPAVDIIRLYDSPKTLPSSLAPLSALENPFFLWKRGILTRWINFHLLWWVNLHLLVTAQATHAIFNGADTTLCLPMFITRASNS